MSDLSRVEQLLRNALGEDIYEVTPQSRVEILLAQLNELIEGLDASVDPEAIAGIVTGWLAENIHDGAVVDSSLSVAGAAAESKKVGDEISDLKEDLREIDSALSTSLDIGNPYGTKGLVSGTAGNFSANQYFTASDFIDVSAYANTVIKVTCGFYNASGLAFYKASKAFISGVSGTSRGTNELATVSVTVPNEAAFLRFSIFDNYGSYSDCNVTVSVISDINNKLNKIQETKDYTKRLILPPYIRMAEGIQYSFHHNNMIQGFCADDCDFFGWQYGAHYDDFSVITPDSTKAAHDIIFNGTTGLNQYINAKFPEPDINTLTGNMFLRAKTASAGNGKTIKGIFIGDSFTAQGKYLYHLIQNCTSNGITLESIGTKSITVNGTTIQHEGRGNWKTSDYATQASKTVGGVTENNPFYHDGAFDFSHYMTEQGYSGLDFVCVFTGVNDSITDSTDTILSSLTTIVNSIKTYDANLPILLWLTPTRCIAPTGGKKRRYYNQNLTYVDCDLAQTFNAVVIDNFSNDSQISIIPVGFNVDPIYDYNLTEQDRNTEDTTHKRYQCADPIHLSDNGYKHIADSVYGTVLYLASLK